MIMNLKTMNTLALITQPTSGPISSFLPCLTYQDLQICPNKVLNKVSLLCVYKY